MYPYLAFTLKTERIQYASYLKVCVFFAYPKSSVLEANQFEFKAQADRFCFH